MTTFPQRVVRSPHFLPTTQAVLNNVGMGALWLVLDRRFLPLGIAWLFMAAWDLVIIGQRIRGRGVSRVVWFGFRASSVIMIVSLLWELVRFIIGPAQGH